MRKIRIAVLDSGFSRDCFDRNEVKIIGQKHLYFDYVLDDVVENEFIDDFNGHGTMCVFTMLNAFENIEFYIIKCLNISGVTNESVFLKALEYTNTLDIDIVAVCASLTHNSSKENLKKAFDNLKKSNKAVVVSVRNGENVSVPACYNSVIGVIGGSLADDKFTYNPNTEIQMQCSSESAVIYGLFGQRTVFRGNSRATALAAAHCARLLFENNAAPSQIYKLLTDNGNICLSTNDFKKKDDNYFDIPFDKRRENELIETDNGYHKFIYMLCEFFLCDDPQKIRYSGLIELNGRYLIRKLEAFLRFVESQFNINMNHIMLRQLQWAYLFYDECININNKENENGKK